MIYETGKYYHVVNRGAHGQLVFVTDENYRFCCSLLAKYSDHYDVSLFAYCLMPNHYHLLVRQEEGGSVRLFLQTTFNAYAQAFNTITRHRGTLFQGRAKGKEVESDEYALRVCRYIHRNPVKAKLVTNAAEWEFSDYRVWAGTQTSTMTNLGLRNGYFTDAGHYREWFSELDNESDLSRFLI